MSILKTFLHDIYERYRALDEGAVANYIPELAKVDPALFGICVVTIEGEVFEVGDTREMFTIQSMSKPFTYGLALGTHGRDKVLAKVGVEPSGDTFNSITLDERSNRPYNPMVNAGAIAITDMVEGTSPSERLNRVLEMFQCYAGRRPYMDGSVFVSERTTGDRNRAMAYLMRNFGMVGNHIDETLDLYFQQCSLLFNCYDTAVMAATLANNGENPITGACAIDADYVQDILSVMYTCGMYNFSGEWAYRVGLPAKSGVGGGIIAVVPQQMGIAVFSPPLDERGTSVRGLRVCSDLSQHFGLHIFHIRDLISMSPSS